MFDWNRLKIENELLVMVEMIDLNIIHYLFQISMESIDYFSYRNLSYNP